MGFDLIHRVETWGRPRILVVGDLILDRYIWGQAERISQEAPVPLLRADHREHRLGGAASVATMLAALEADVLLAGVVGDDEAGATVRRLLAEHGIDDRLVLTVDDRPTTLKERYIGRAQDRHPQQMIRVDYEVRDPIPAAATKSLRDAMARAIADTAITLVSDYDKGVCTPGLLRDVTAAGRDAGRRVVVDPIRGTEYSRYAGMSSMTPNRLEAGLATGRTIHTTDDALEVGRTLVDRLGLEAALVTLDRDGMALARADGRSELVPTRPRQVYDITGAGDMVLAVVGLSLAAGADYDEAAALGNVAGGLEVEQIGVALLSRSELLRDLIEHQATGGTKRLTPELAAAECRRRRTAGQRVVLVQGLSWPIDARTVRGLAEAAATGDFLVASLPDGPMREDQVEVVAALGAVHAVIVPADDGPALDVDRVIDLRSDSARTGTATGSSITIHPAEATPPAPRAITAAARQAVK
jgi:D-beta-D-heptose 7-phosphate kinase/D-beta-D-heptose 1-phosphate adenosyltransferase